MLQRPIRWRRILRVTADEAARRCATTDPGQWLGDAELEHLETLHIDRRRRDWLAGRIAAKRAVRRALLRSGVRVSDRDVQVLPAANGAPLLRVTGVPHASRLVRLSIAHDDGTALCGVADAAWGRIGVDIERDRPLAAERLAYVLSDAERARLGRASDLDALAIWAVKEAVVKAANDWAPAMRDVDVTLHRDASVVVRLRDGAPAVSAGYRRWDAHLVAWARCRVPGRAGAGR
jgi:4'-phosphopantetheinyl transferase EntD